MLEGHPSHCFIWGRENNIHNLKRFCASENTHEEPCVFCPRCRCMPAWRHIGYIFILMRIHVLSQIFSLRIQSNLCSWPSSPHSRTFAIQLLFYLHFIFDTCSFSCEYISFLRSFLCEQSFKASWPSSPHNHNFAIQLLFYLHFIMRVIQLVITIALLSYQESSGVAALSSPLRGAERRAKSGKTTKKKGNSEEATVRNPL